MDIRINERTQDEDVANRLGVETETLVGFRFDLPAQASAVAPA
jgi:hypothetical protein